MSNDNNETVIRIPTGSTVQVENHNGDNPIRVLVVNNNTGDASNRMVQPGASVADVVGGQPGHISRNGSPAQMSDELEDGDKLSVTPENVDGNK